MRNKLSSVGTLICIFVFLLTLPTPPSAAQVCTGPRIATLASGTNTGQIIRNASELSAAIRNAKGGETLTLQGGNYGPLKINKAFQNLVTIQSVAPGSPACFTELRLKKAKNVALDGLFFDYEYSKGHKDSANRFSILESRNITITNSVFDGGHRSGAGHGRGLRIRNSLSINITHSIFRKWWKALTGDSVVDLTIIGNDFSDIRSDGIALGVIDGLVIEANRLHNFRGVKGNKDHRDMIQILRSSNQRSTDIVIRNNIFDIGAGDYAQTIWMGGDGKNLGNPMLRHQNVLIENNMIYNAHTHGISVHGIDNLSIRKNSVIRVRRAEKGKVTVPRINVSGSTYVVIEQNAVGGIIGYKNQKDWVVLNNVIIQDQSPSAPGYYDREFIYYATGQANGFHEYGVRPGSEIDRLNAGSSLVNKYPTRK
ncbi:MULTISPECIES: right-handed parallel beta-helix repeat-containing protein [unclassified Ruegeria]|uniref:right-handed parallel beta-helix repeat-containing protein n=1 Tax=unclassified Ruegeria TaxID=2625375 RepID=UPI001AE65092|nr:MULTISPECIES: right-handed parallel beta-helix repeat-containing protein [unclassified Ruegeria]